MFTKHKDTAPPRVRKILEPIPSQPTRRASRKKLCKILKAEHVYNQLKRKMGSIRALSCVCGKEKALAYPGDHSDVQTRKECYRWNCKHEGVYKLTRKDFGW